MRSQLFIFAFLPLVMLACGADSEGDDDNTAANDEDIVGGGPKLSADRLLEDSDILGGEKITAQQVQSFLQSKGSYLATFKEGGKSAAEIIVENCRETGINPVYMLARIQGESSLIESKTPKGSHVAKATGCGCPDGKACSSEHAGFGNQITCAANLMKKYFQQMDDGGQTTSGWGPKKRKETLDPCEVTPANRATAALYTYTPWVGAYTTSSCGAKKWAGSSGMAKFTLKYREAFPSAATGNNNGEGEKESPEPGGDEAPTPRPRPTPNPDEPPAGGCFSPSLGRNVAPLTCVFSKEDQVLQQCNDGKWYRGVEDNEGPFGPCAAE